MLIVCFFANTGDRWVHLLDGANLALHEAGFVVFPGWAGVLVAWGWLTWRWWQDREMA